MCELKTQIPQNRKFIDLPKACELTGLSKSTIYRRVKKRELPAYRFSRNLNFKDEEVLAWMNSSSTLTQKQLA